MPHSIRCMPLRRPIPVRAVVLIAVILLAVLLRVANFPPRYCARNMDEMGYCAGSLQLIEGITPGNKAAPAGPLYWVGWVYLGGQTAWDFLHPSIAERQLALPVRPFTALDIG